MHAASLQDNAPEQVSNWNLTQVGEPRAIWPIQHRPVISH